MRHLSWMSNNWPEQLKIHVHRYSSWVHLKRGGDSPRQAFVSQNDLSLGRYLIHIGIYAFIFITRFTIRSLAAPSVSEFIIFSYVLLKTAIVPQEKRYLQTKSAELYLNKPAKPVVCTPVDWGTEYQNKCIVCTVCMCLYKYWNVGDYKWICTEIIINLSSKSKRNNASISSISLPSLNLSLTAVSVFRREASGFIPDRASILQTHGSS